MKANKAPLLPPRPPATLPKKYQPLSPEPVNHRPCSQPHTFPEVQGGPRQISLKDLSEVLRAEKAFRHQVTPQSSQLSQNQAMQEISLGIPSPSFMVSSHSVQNRDPTGSTQSSSPQRCQSPAGYGPHKNKLPCEPPGWRRPCPTPPDHKGIQHSEWYIGQYGRRVVEEALMKENKDGTFFGPRLFHEIQGGALCFGGILWEQSLQRENPLPGEESAVCPGDRTQRR